MLLERLLDNLAVDVEAFAVCSVAPGWRLRLPSRAWVGFYYVLEGQGEVRGGRSGSRPLSAGSLVVAPPGLAHVIQCGSGPYGESGEGGGRDDPGGLPSHRAGPREEGELTLACGRIEVLFGRGLGLFDQLREMLVLDFSDESRVLTLVEGLLDEVRSERPGSRAMATALMNESLIHVFRRLCKQDECTLPWLQALDYPDLTPAVSAMLEGPEEPHSVADLAARCHMSRSCFARRFRETFDRSPMAYLRAVRLRRAARLLRRTPPPSVRAVASRVGFASRSHFSRAFKEHFDCPPSEFSP